jgi:hypothetical protein
LILATLPSRKRGRANAYGKRERLLFPRPSTTQTGEENNALPPVSLRPQRSGRLRLSFGGRVLLNVSAEAQAKVEVERRQERVAGRAFFEKQSKEIKEIRKS